MSKRTGGTPLDESQLDLFLTAVGHSLNMMTELPLHLANTSLNDCVRLATLDSFFVHARGLVEFFLCPGSYSVSAQEYVPKWSETTDTNPSLGPLVGEVSTSVVHLSPARVAEGSVVTGVSHSRLLVYADQIVSVAERFVAALGDKQSPNHRRAAEVIGEARVRLTNVTTELAPGDSA